MGLILNGSVYGKSYSDQTVTAEELLEIFQLKDKFKRLGTVLRFDLDESMMRKSGGEILHPQQVGLMCITSGSYEGDNFELIYFKTRVRKEAPTGTYYDFKPRKVYISGVSHAVNVKENKELAVYMFLHQNCMNSPTRKPGSRVIYKVHDAEEKSKEAYKKNKTIMGIYEELMTDDVDVLRLKAQGLKLGNMSHRTDEEVRMVIVEHFEKMRSQGKMNKFVEQFNSPYSMFTGLIMEAIQRNILVQTPNRGFFDYKWGPGTDLEGRVACTVPKGETPIEALIQYAQGNYEYFLTTIEKEINKDKERAGINKYLDKIKDNWSRGIMVSDLDKDSEVKSAFEMDADELIRFALGNDALELNRLDKKVYLISKGEIDGEHIFVPVDHTVWVPEFAIFLEDEANKDLNKKLRQKVQGHLSTIKKKSKAKA